MRSPTSIAFWGRKLSSCGTPKKAKAAISRTMTTHLPGPSSILRKALIMEVPATVA